NPAMDVERQYPVGWAYYLVRRYDDAVRVMEVGVRQNPDDYFDLAALAASYAELGRMDDAAGAAAATLRAWPFFQVETFISQFEREEDRVLIAEGLRKAGLR